jgi:hypothetical protein
MAGRCLGQGKTGGRRWLGGHRLTRSRVGHRWPSGVAASVVLVAAALLAFPSFATQLGVPLTAAHQGEPASGGEDTAALSDGDWGGESSQEDAESADAPASSSPPDTETLANEVCQERLARLAGPDNPFSTELIGAYPTSAGEAATAHEQRRGAGFRSRLRDMDPSTFGAVCFFEADAIGLAHLPPEGVPLPDDVFTRVQEVVLVDGEVVGLAVGKAEMRPAPLSGEVGR